MTGRSVLLVGSIPLADAGAVFRAAGEAVGPLLRRVPDGETGERRGWIGWQSRLFAAQPALEPVAEKERDYQFRPPLRLRPGRQAGQISFGPLGYAAAAADSYARFEAARAAGRFPKACRFQIALPTAWAPVYSSIAYESQPAVYPHYEAALLRELDGILAAIPAADLAIQWDVATELSWLEQLYPAPFPDAWAGVTAALTTLGGAVPDGIELGFHLCYGSMGNKHWKEPESTALMVRLANALAAAVPRRIDWLHLPVPRDRADDAYFAPLAGLRLDPATELYLGLVHADGIEANARRIAAAAAHRASFGIGAECGLGRFDPAAIPELLRMHAEVARLA
jgi:hypothetical protein